MTRLSVTEMLAARVLSCVCCRLMITITAGRQVRSHQLIPSQSRKWTLGFDLYPSPPKGPGCPVELLLGMKKLAEGSGVALTLAQHPRQPLANEFGGGGSGEGGSDGVRGKLVPAPLSRPHSFIGKESGKQPAGGSKANHWHLCSHSGPLPQTPATAQVSGDPLVAAWPGTVPALAPWP